MTDKMEKKPTFDPSSVEDDMDTLRPREVLIRKIRAVFTLYGVGPAAFSTMRAQDGWEFEDTDRGIICTRTVKPGLPASPPFKQCFRVGHGNVKWTDYETE